MIRIDGTGIAPSGWTHYPTCRDLTNDRSVGAAGSIKRSHTRSWLTPWIKPDDASTLHHECHPPKGRDIVQRIALHRHQVRLEAGRNGSDPAAQPERLSRHRSPAEDRVHR